MTQKLSSPSGGLFTEEEKSTLASWLVQALDAVIASQGHLIAEISVKTCEEVIDRYCHDIDRLMENKPAGLHPAKHIGYLSFWVRKLKPISQCYNRRNIKGGRLSHKLEILDINERIAIWLAMLNLLAYVDKKQVPELASDAASIDDVVNAIKSILSVRSDVGASEGSIKEALIYDMRYRTFGPHHLVHLIYQIIWASRRSHGP